MGDKLISGVVGLFLFIFLCGLVAANMVAAVTLGIIALAIIIAWGWATRRPEKGEGGGVHHHHWR